VVGTEDLQVKKVTGQITALSQPGRSSKPVGTGELIEHATVTGQHHRVIH